MKEMTVSLWEEEMMFTSKDAKNITVKNLENLFSAVLIFPHLFISDMEEVAVKWFKMNHTQKVRTAQETRYKVRNIDDV